MSIKLKRMKKNQSIRVARLNALLRAINTTKSKFEASTNIINIITNAEVLTEKLNEN